jgi:hypothetical protein
MLGSYSDSGGVVEIDVVYDGIEDVAHIVYGASTEARYQKFDFLSEVFLSVYKFVDFNSSSVSIDLNSDGEVILSYSHIEVGLPLTTFLKIARSSNGVSTFKTFNIDSSSGLMSGEFSDIVIDDDDKMFIVYLNNGVLIYDEQKNIDENFIETTSWKDRKFVNNLVASANPPTRSVEATFMEFTAENEQYFYIGDSSSSDLDENSTEFSIAFSIIPKGVSTSNQTIVGKGNSVDGGYQIFLGGDEGLTLGFSLVTVYDSIEIMVADIDADRLSKVAFVYSGYDVKIYIKRASDENFSLNRYNIFGDALKNDSPFVIGASSAKTGDDENPYYSYPSTGSSFEFDNFLDAKIVNLKYWKRELSYE